MRLYRALGLILLGLAPLLIRGQQTPAPQPASIMGTVTDARGGVIPSAAVVLAGPADRTTVAADGNGLFVFTNLHPAVPYHVDVSAKGFATWTSAAIVLKPGQNLGLSVIKLNIALVQTTVSALTVEQIATQQVEVAEKQRVLGVFPNFYVSYDPNPVPLTTRLKYRLALRSAFDPINFAATAAFAGFNQAGDTPDYQQGAKGYAQRFGAAYTDGFTDILIGGAILPSLLHQDPRYFYQGTGTIGSRIRHAVANSILCKGDNGRPQFNYSGVGGDMISGALSNIYYPPSNRGPGIVFYNALLSAAGRAADNLAQEFLFRRFTPSARKQP
jgi:hypothetical protein